MVRWVPYKHANGMAIYYRQTPQEEGMPQVGLGAVCSLRLVHAYSHAHSHCLTYQQQANLHVDHALTVQNI